MEDTEKEELTNQETVNQGSEEETVEENVEDYFNPFADISDEDKKIEEDIEEIGWYTKNLILSGKRPIFNNIVDLLEMI